MTRTEWYKNAVVYQIYPFSFMDANDDGWGDLAGIASKLDYLKELGVTAIWFSPLYKSPCADYGYDIADYKDIDPKFGSLDEFKALLAAAHEKGIRVIMDMALNHSSIEHPWFREAIRDTESPYRSYYLIREGKRKGKKLLPPTNWSSTFTGSAWERIEGTDDFYLHLFCVEQADLNWENEAVRKEAADIFNFWLELGVDGFRLDVFNMFSKVYPLCDGKKKMMGTGEEFYIDGPRMHEFLKELNARSFSRYDSYTVGESYNPHVEDRKLYVDKDSHELDTIFNFGHFESDAMGKFFKKKFDLGVFKAGLFDPQLENFGKGWNTLVLENHDGSRSNARFGIDVRKYHYEASTFLPAITFLGFGTPFIYMGQEFGQTNVRFDRIEDCKDPVSHFIYDMLTGYLVPKKLAMRAINYGARDMARVPVRWDGSVNNGFNRGHEPWQKPMTPLVDVNLEKDLASEKSVFRFYQKVLEIKKTVPAAVYGDIREYGRKDKQVVAFSRFLGDEGLLVFGNFSAKKAKFTLPAELEGFTKTLLLSNYESETPADGVYELKPYEVLVYQLGK